MRDYDIQLLQKQNPKLYVEKMLTYYVWHGYKIEKNLVWQYIDDIDLEENKREFFKFLLSEQNEK